MTGGWWDGYEDGFDDLDQPKPRSIYESQLKKQNHQQEKEKTEPTPPTDTSIITCHHCGSTKLKLRSSSTEHDDITFKCSACNKLTEINLPYSYERVYRKIT